MARKRIKVNLPNLYLISGLLLLSIFFIWKYHQARILSFNTREIAKVNFSGVKPIHIKSYPIGVDIDIKDGVIKNGVWTIYPNNAIYLLGSSGIGDEGNIIIYGHNKDNILGPIRWIKIGAKIEIIGSDNKSYNYEVIKTDTVSSDNLEYIKPTNEETLTLYTCTGFLDSQRFMVVAEKIK
ncbi:MAG TPA: sortase [Patescibacteria group bacterium]|nr:sortase [Patescibacteria group bacterium]